MNFLPFSSWNVWGVFFYCMGLLVFSLVLHNKFKTWWIGVFLITTYILSSYLFITSPTEWWFFLFGAISYTVVDNLAVYLHMWRYNTSHGYAVWAGPAWGILTIFVHRMTAAVTWPFIIFILLFASVLIFSKGKNQFDLKLFNVMRTILIIFSAIFFTKIFLVSFGLGVLIEYFAVEIFHTWKYPQPAYLQLGFGYAILMSCIEIFFTFTTGVFPMSYMLFMGGMIVYFILTYAPSLIKKTEPRSKRKLKSTKNYSIGM